MSAPEALEVGSNALSPPQAAEGKSNCSAHRMLSALPARKAVVTGYVLQNTTEQNPKIVTAIHISWNTVTLIILRTLKPWNGIRFMRSRAKHHRKYSL